jgi:hypothetical protein
MANLVSYISHFTISNGPEVPLPPSVAVTGQVPSNQQYIWITT